MKKLVRIVSLAAAVAVLPSLVSAQVFKDDSKALYAGLLSGESAWGGLGLGVGFEAGIGKKIADMVALSVGADAGFMRHSNSYFGSTFGYKVTTVPVTVFVNGHYQLKQVEKLDLYAGPVVGFAHTSWSWDGDDVFYRNVFGGSQNNVVVGVHAGARYELTPSLLGNLQLSGGSGHLPWINVGVALKF